MEVFELTWLEVIGSAGGLLLLKSSFDFFVN
jgi:hypothetical protein